MKLTDEQFNALAPYEEHFKSACKNNDSRWSRHPGAAALDLMQSIYLSAVGQRPRLNKSCGHCILTLIHDIGLIWLADKEERIIRKNDKAMVELSMQMASEKKVAVKTRKPRKKANAD